MDEYTHYSFEKGYHNPYSDNADPLSYEYQASLFDVQSIFKDEKQEGCIIDPPIRSYLSQKVLTIVDQHCSTTHYHKCLLSPHYVLDIFKYFYQAYDHLLNVTPEKYHWHYLLTKMDNWLLKTITDSRVLYSVLATCAIVKKIDNVLRNAQKKIGNIEWQFQSVEVNWMDVLMSSMEGKTHDRFKYYAGDPEQREGIMDVLKSIPSNVEKAIQSGLRQAKKDIDKYREFSGNSAGDSEADLDYLSVYLDPKIIKAISVSGNSINKFVTKIIDTSVETLGGVAKTYQESIFDADDIQDVEGLENLIHPALYKELYVKTTKYHMNFDVYLDDSGSMTGRSYLKDGSSITSRILVRFIAIKMRHLGILKDTYIFDSRIEKVSFDNLLSARLGGGTDFTPIVENVIKNNRPAIVITDGQGSMRCYSDKVFFININTGWWGSIYDGKKSFLAKTVSEGKYALWDKGDFYQAKLEPRATSYDKDVSYYDITPGKKL